RRRTVRRDSVAAGPDELSVRRLFQSAAHGVGLVQPRLGRVRGHLYPAVRHGCVDRPPAPLEERERNMSTPNSQRPMPNPQLPMGNARQQREAAPGSWELEVGRSQLELGSWELEVGS